MDPVLVLLLGLLVGLGLGAVVGWLFGRSAGSAPADAALDLVAARTSAAALREQLEHQREELGRRAADDRSESQVLQALAPVTETLRTMQAKVADLEQQRHTQHGELQEQILATRASAEQSRAAAAHLAAALSNNSTRGVWGEAQLRSLVESAGLLDRVDFTMQTTITAESGSRRPDMVLRLPGGKSIAVDAKVPYSAYMQAHDLDGSGDPDAADRRSALLSRHAGQVRGHVDALASKTYWSGLDASPEFTIAFIPTEPLLAAALAQDPTLLDHAFAQRVALASPVSLWAVLKTVAFTWQQDVLTEDAKQLFDLGKQLHSRLSTMAEHADKLRRSIEGTVSSYNQFASSLESRVLVTARKLDGLDESRVIGTPGVIETSPRPLTAPELVPE
ncbi:DNA recombination protein RmuC [Aeromicrobium marinum]|nr:DNA recombination protein RmuC [Aeromicrobium marinum]